MSKKVNSENKGQFMSIRDFSKLGYISEYSLRLMNARGELPKITVGKRTYIDCDALIKQINAGASSIL